MQRLLSVKQATKILKKTNTCNNNISIHKSLQNNSFSHFTTLSNTNLAYGFCKNTTILNHFLKNNVFKGLKEGFSNYRVGFLKIQNFSNSSFQVHRRGWQSWLRRISPDKVVLGLIITNVAVFLLWRVADKKFMMNNFMISLDNFRSGRVHTMITSAFSQVDAGHLVSNMIGLYFFGTNIGRTFGSEFLLKLYLAGAFVGSVFYLVHKGYLALNSKNDGGWGMNPSRIPGLGASGAVNAIMLLDIFLNPKATLYLEFIIPVPAILLGIFLIGKDVLRILEGDSQISGSAHLGGAFVAALAWARFRKRLF